jgi:hypothetical protein
MRDDMQLPSRRHKIKLFDWLRFQSASTSQLKSFILYNVETATVNPRAYIFLANLGEIIYIIMQRCTVCIGDVFLLVFIPFIHLQYIHDNVEQFPSTSDNSLLAPHRPISVV